MLYRIFRALARLSLHVFFRRIEAEGHEHVPAQGPLLFVPNHANALVDPLVLMSCLGRPLTVTAKNVLARNPLMRFLMAALGVVTFHRRQDVGKGADVRQNLHSRERCRETAPYDKTEVTRSRRGDRSCHADLSEAARYDLR